MYYTLFKWLDKNGIECFEVVCTNSTHAFNSFVEGLELDGGFDITSESCDKNGNPKHDQ